jgi:hypothetical protein
MGRQCIERARRVKKYKLMLTFLKFLRVLLAIPVTPGHIRGSLHRQRGILRDMQAKMTVEHWVRSFRMTLDDVQALYSKVADALYRDPVKATNSSGSPIAC